MSLISDIMDGVLFTDCDGKIAFMNPAAEDLLGVKSFLAIGHTLAEIEDAGELVEAMLQDVESLELRDDTSRTVEVHQTSHDLVYIKLRTSRIVDYLGVTTGVLSVMQDVTDEYKTDQIKNQYLSIVAHELRTPLTGIKTFSTMLGKGALGDLSEKQDRAVASIREQSLRLEQQIDKLINIGHIESDEQCYGQNLDTFDLFEMIESAVGPFRQVAASREIELHIEHGDGDALARGDRSDLRRAFQAILENAIKFATDGGTVVVGVNQVQGQLLVSIQDDGPGIDPRYHGRIFEKFFQVEDPLTRHHGGAGLGLFFARGIIDAHDTELTVESEIGNGARFSFGVPIADKSDSNASATSATTAAPN